MTYPISFASDNYAGIHPKILHAIQAANQGHSPAYGNDSWSQRAISLFKQLLGDSVEVFFVFNGTGANVLSLKSIMSSYHAVICSDCAHINVDECGAPEYFTGCKLLTIPHQEGKVSRDLIAKRIIRLEDEHHVQAKVVSITQSTEYGTVYTPDEIRDIANLVHSKDMFLHMDGARIANAAASLGLSLKAITADAGVDVLSFGGTKNGLMGAEAVVFFNSELAKNFKYIRKQSMQLASKMRFMAAQFEALLTDNLWLENAKHANEMAQRLFLQIQHLPKLKVISPVQVNSLFVQLPADVIPLLQREFSFYVWDDKNSIVRWMTAFDTLPEHVDAFARAIQELCC